MRSLIYTFRKKSNTLFFLFSFVVLLVMTGSSMYLISSINAVNQSITNILGTQATILSPLQDKVFSTDIHLYVKEVLLFDDLGATDSVIDYNFSLNYENPDLDVVYEDGNNIDYNFDTIGIRNLNLDILLGTTNTEISKSGSQVKDTLDKGEVMLSQTMMQKWNLKLDDVIILSHGPSSMQAKFRIVASYHYDDDFNDNLAIGTDKIINNNLYISIDSLLEFIQEDIDVIGKDGWNGMLEFERNIFSMDPNLDYQSNTNSFLVNHPNQIDLNQYSVIYSTDILNKISGEMTSMKILSAYLGVAIIVVVWIIAILLIMFNFNLRKKEAKIYLENGFSNKHIVGIISSQLILVLSIAFFITQLMSQLITKMLVSILKIDVYITSTLDKVGQNSLGRDIIKVADNESLRIYMIVSAVFIAVLIVVVNKTIMSKMNN